MSARYYEPYVLNTHDAVESMSLLASLTTLWAGLLLGSDTFKRETKEVRDGLAWGIITVNAIFVLRLIVGVGSILINRDTVHGVTRRMPCCKTRQFMNTRANSVNTVNLRRRRQTTDDIEGGVEMANLVGTDPPLAAGNTNEGAIPTVNGDGDDGEWRNTESARARSAFLRMFKQCHGHLYDKDVRLHCRAPSHYRTPDPACCVHPPPKKKLSITRQCAPHAPKVLASHTLARCSPPSIHSTSPRKNILQIVKKYLAKEAERIRAKCDLLDPLDEENESEDEEGGDVEDCEGKDDQAGGLGLGVSLKRRAAAQAAQAKQEKQEKQEKRVSWGRTTQFDSEHHTINVGNPLAARGVQDMDGEVLSALRQVSRDGGNGLHKMGRGSSRRHGKMSSRSSRGSRRHVSRGSSRREGKTDNGEELSTLRQVSRDGGGGGRRKVGRGTSRRHGNASGIGSSGSRRHDARRSGGSRRHASRRSNRHGERNMSPGQWRAYRSAVGREVSREESRDSSWADSSSGGSDESSSKDSSTESDSDSESDYSTTDSDSSGSSGSTSSSDSASDHGSSVHSETTASPRESSTVGESDYSSSSSEYTRSSSDSSGSSSSEDTGSSSYSSSGSGEEFATGGAAGGGGGAGGVAGGGGKVASLPNELKELALLHKEGILSDEEFAQAKAKLLN